MLQQLDAFRHVNIPVKSCRSIRMGKKEDLSEFEHGMMLGVNELVRLSPIQTILGFTEKSGFAEEWQQ